MCGCIVCVCIDTCIKGPSGTLDHGPTMVIFHSIFLAYPVVSWLTIHGLGQINMFLFSRLVRLGHVVLFPTQALDDLELSA